MEKVDKNEKAPQLTWVEIEKIFRAGYNRRDNILGNPEFKDYIEKKFNLSIIDKEKERIAEEQKLAKIEKERVERLELFEYYEEHLFAEGIEEKIKPIKDWAKANLKLGLESHDLSIHSTSDIRHIANKLETAQCKVIHLDHDDPEIIKASTIYEDNDVLVTGFNDHDFGYSMLKYTVKCKHTKVFHRDAEMYAAD